MEDHEMIANNEEHEGLLRHLVSLSTHLTQTSVQTAFGSAQDVRENGLRRVRGLIDWVESVQQANVEIARKLTDRFDHMSETLLGTGERALTTLVAATRETGHGVADVASRSAGAFISKRPDAASLS